MQLDAACHRPVQLGKVRQFHISDDFPERKTISGDIRLFSDHKGLRASRTSHNSQLDAACLGPVQLGKVWQFHIKHAGKHAGLTNSQAKAWQGFRIHLKQGTQFKFCR